LEARQKRDVMGVRADCRVSLKWHRKSLPTFADAIAIVRQRLWTSTHFSISPAKADRVEIPCALLNRLTDTLCYAA
jgi:hypothetical protein